MDLELAAAVLVVLLGGSVFAAMMALTNRRPSSGLVSRSVVEPLSPDAINMSHIRVEGVGGLGLIAAGVVIALYLPGVGVSLVAGVGLGAAIAVGLILYRSRLSATRPGGYNGQPPSLLTLDDHPMPVRPCAGHDLPRARRAATA